MYGIHSVACRWKEGASSGGPGHPLDVYFGGRHPIKIAIINDNYGCIQIKELVPGIHSHSDSWPRAFTCLCTPMRVLLFIAGIHLVSDIIMSPT